ncbi:MULTISPECIES: hypothetical protein [Calothrix]|uniref:Uncharacterized protein n=2 Tax=Calothrix TaxID=1186 RepID=A0ABR8A7D3_9CYAN|nr:MULTISPECIES: hypothetical protein [Calothrix]MBD2195902.1 hypothetical protein [Calothrix parietina FACHB-288]MBD2227616.1 hypothetical protein [Calothrix anomala FACHB-343]
MSYRKNAIASDIAKLQKTFPSSVNSQQSTVNSQQSTVNKLIVFLQFPKRQVVSLPLHM